MFQCSLDFYSPFSRFQDKDTIRIVFKKYFFFFFQFALPWPHHAFGESSTHSPVRIVTTMRGIMKIWHR